MDTYQIRVERLKSLIKEEYEDNQTAFANAIGMKPPHVNRWLSDTASDRRVISEKSARKIERILGKPTGWMDNSDIHESEEDNEIMKMLKDMEEGKKKAIIEMIRAFSKENK